MAVIQIPTTVYVPPFPTTSEDQYSFFTAVAGFANGAQSVKINTLTYESDDTIYQVGPVRSLRTGNQVYLEGEIVIDNAYFFNVDVLPVLPRFNGFISLYNEDEGLKVLTIKENDKKLYGTISDGTYYIKGTYIPRVKPQGTIGDI